MGVLVAADRLTGGSVDMAEPVQPAPHQDPAGCDRGQATQQVPQPEDGSRVRAHRHRRPLARRVCRGPRQRDRRDRHSGAAPCGGLVRGARHHHRAGAVGQRFPVRVPPMASDLRRARHPALAHQAATAADQRQDRALPPHPGRRMGLRPLLRLRSRTTRPSASMAARVQPPPTPHRLREQATHQPLDPTCQVSTARHPRVSPLPIEWSTKAW